MATKAEKRVKRRSENTSAQSALEAFLDQYGLGSLGQWAWDRYTGADGGPGATMVEIRNELVTRPEFKARFPAYDQLAKDGRAISPNEYIAYEKNVLGLLKQYGVPAGMYDSPADFARLLVNDVSVAEVQQRLTIAATAAFKAPQSVRDALAQRYGVGARDLVGYYLDPDKALPLMEQQFISAQLAGAAEDAGITVATQTAERLASQGYTYEQGRQGFSNVRQLDDLRQNVDGQSASQDDLIGSQFDDAESKAKVERLARERSARYQAAEGGAAATSAGVSGLRSASQ